MNLSNLLRTVDHAPYNTKDGRCIEGIMHAFPYQEEGIPEVIRQYDLQSWQKNDVHIGVAGFFNLDVVAAGAPYFLAVDVNAKQEHFWRRIEQLITESETRDQFISTLIKNPLPVQMKNKTFFVNEVYAERDREGSWLSSEENYQRVRHMFMEHKFAFLPLDIRDVGRCEQIKEALQESGLRIASIYLSNVPLAIAAERDFYHQPTQHNDIRKMLGNVESLMNDGAQLIVSGLSGGVGTSRYDSYDPEIVDLRAMKEAMSRRKEVRSV